MTHYGLTPDFLDSLHFIVIDQSNPDAYLCPRLSIEDAKDLADELNRNSCEIRFEIVDVELEAE